MLVLINTVGQRLPQYSKGATQNFPPLLVRCQNCLSFSKNSRDENCVHTHKLSRIEPNLGTH